MSNQLVLVIKINLPFSLGFSGENSILNLVQALSNQQIHQSARGGSENSKPPWQDLNILILFGFAAQKI
jgi:hypothetical protein